MKDIKIDNWICNTGWNLNSASCEIYWMNYFHLLRNLRAKTVETKFSIEIKKLFDGQEKTGVLI